MSSKKPENKPEVKKPEAEKPETITVTLTVNKALEILRVYNVLIRNSDDKTMDVNTNAKNELAAIFAAAQKGK